ncbi:MAG TPA: hypothetical protein VEF33_03840, partial [Syntrophales bacterium]|nr:hypothetical protein [Syntrophales bacterium]
DGLERDMKRIIQEASVIGRAFLYEILKRVTELKDMIDKSLSGLERLELIRTRTIQPDLEYIFKHALTQEVAYNSLLLKRRKEIHERIGKAIEELYPERLEEFYEMLAYHYARGEGLEKASQYLKLSGNKAARNHSIWEAYGFYKEALATLLRLPETVANKKEKVEVLVLMTGPMQLLGFPEESLGMLQEGENLSMDLGDNRTLAFFQGRLGAYYAYRGTHLVRVKYLEEAFEESRKSQDIDLIVPTAQGLCLNYIRTGHYSKVADIIPDVLELFEKNGRESDFFANVVNPYSSLCAFCGMSMGYLGNFNEGRIFFEKGLRYAAQIGDLRTLGLVELNYGLFFHTKGDWKPAMEHFQNSIKYSEKVKFLAPLAWSWSYLGNLYSYLEDPETGRRYVEKGLKIQQDGGFEWFLSFHPFFLGDIHLHRGDIKNARSSVDEALRLSQKNNEKLMEGRSWILLGRIMGLAETPQTNRAKEYLLQGMKILDELKLKPDYALGCFYLGDLYTNAGQKKKALENLKKAKTMFQEMGMDYWLGRARELLESLGA